MQRRTGNHAQCPALGGALEEIQIQSLMRDFGEVARLAGIDISHDDLSRESMGCPHEPPRDLPTGRVAVYVFCFGDRCLKVGKAGPKTKQRFTYQHYHPRSAASTLAASLVKGQRQIGLSGLTEDNVGDWIRQNTFRLNLFLNSTTHRFSLSPLEAFLQARLNPVFEGSGMRQGRRVRFATCSLLVQELLVAKRDLTLPQALKRLARYEALVVDDLRYVRQDRDEIEVLFTLLAERYERGSVLITSNLPFSRWEEIVKDPMTTAAAIGRLVHHSAILELNLPSYRVEQAQRRRPRSANETSTGHTANNNG